MGINSNTHRYITVAAWAEEQAIKNPPTLVCYTVEKDARRDIMRDINRDTFDESPAKTKMSLLFDSICNIEDKVDALTKKLDAKLKIDKVYVCVGGFLGAAFALLLREVPKWIL